MDYDYISTAYGPSGEKSGRHFYRVTGETMKQWHEAQGRHNARMQHIYNMQDEDYKQKQKKAQGFILAKEKRKILGKLTAKEIEAGEQATGNPNQIQYAGTKKPIPLVPSMPVTDVPVSPVARKINLSPCLLYTSDAADE